MAKGTPSGKDDFFLAQFSDAGQLEWLSYGGGSGFDAANSIDADADGNVYITGYFDQKASFTDQQGITHELMGQRYDVYLAKVTAEGALSWIRSAGGELWDNAYDVHIDQEGHAYVTGLFRRTADFTGNQEADIEGEGEANAFVVKYRTDGVLSGLRIIDGQKSEGFGVATDRLDNVYLTGLFVQEARFDPNTPSLNSSFFNSFIAKYEAGSMENGIVDSNEWLSSTNDTGILAQNFPNPFSTQTRIDVRLSDADEIRLTVYDTLGRLVSEITRSHHSAGIHRFVFDSGRLATGLYYYTLETSTSRVTRTMTITR